MVLLHSISYVIFLNSIEASNKYIYVAEKMHRKKDETDKKRLIALQILSYTIISKSQFNRKSDIMASS